MAKLKNPYPLCARDEFPMVQIGDKKQCVAEYLDKHIGRKKIVDAIRHDDIAYYIFENGYELPLLCFCCSKPLVIEDLDKVRRDMRGRRLESMAIETVEATDGDDFLEFQLEFSPKGIELKNKIQPIAPEAAARMKIPNAQKSNRILSKNKRSRARTKKGFG